MTKQVQRRRGTSTQHTSFTGAEGELSVNTTNKSVHVHDGSSAGGFELARADFANVSNPSFDSDATVNGITVGRGAGNINSNTANGYRALYSNTTGANNTASGKDTLYSNTTGSSNTANGIQALYSNTVGSNNVAIGQFALKNASGSENVALGRSALFTQTTGSGNFGAAFRNSSGTYAPVFNPTTHDNRVVMGHTGVTNAYVQVAWTVVSDARDKTEIESLAKGLDFVNQLNPVSYKFRKDRETEETNGKKRYGFLAQEVLDVEGEDNVIVDTEDLDKLKMTNEAMIPVLVKAIQELKAEVETLKAQ